MHPGPHSTPYVRFGNEDGQFLYISAAAGVRLGERADLYEYGRVLALVNAPEGRLRVRDKDGFGTTKTIHAQALGDYLAERFPDAEERRLPAWYDEAYDALLFGPEECEDVLFDGRFRALELSEISRESFVPSGAGLKVTHRFPARSRVLVKDGILAFFKQEDGPVTVERREGAYLLRKPEVVEFARRNWEGRQLYSRRLGEATLVAAGVESLAHLADLAGFTALSLAGRPALELTRERAIRLTGAAELFPGRFSVYACGSLLALQPDGAGELEVEWREDGAGHVHAPRLYQQLMLRYPGSERLELLPYGDLLLLGETGTLPESLLPPDYFCQLVIL